jgi:hypothetical protein
MKKCWGMPNSEQIGVDGNVDGRRANPKGVARNHWVRQLVRRRVFETATQTIMTTKTATGDSNDSLWGTLSAVRKAVVVEDERMARKRE